MGLQITPTPLHVYASGSETKTLYAYGDTVYYGEDATVSSTTHVGTIANGGSLTISDDKWFVTARDVGGGKPGAAALIVVEADVSETSAWLGDTEPARANSGDLWFRANDDGGLSIFRIT